MEPKRKLRRFTVDEYMEMARVGILKRGDRVELIRGEIVEMTPIGPDHVGHVIRVSHLLITRLKDRALVCVQGSVKIDYRSMPEPDFAILRPRDDYYTKAHATPSDMLLIVEVADSSLAWDRITKARLYAKARIPEFWIVNLRDRCLEVFRQPGAIGYGEHMIQRPPETVRPLAFPDVEIAITDILLD